MRDVTTLRKLEDSIAVTRQQGSKSNLFAGAAAVTISAMNVDGNGRAALASFMTKTCFSDELAILHSGMQSLELRHPEQDWFGQLRIICESVTTAIIEVGGIGLTVRICAKNVAIV